MESSGTPPPPDEPREEGTPPPGPEEGDAPLPPWYRTPEATPGDGGGEGDAGPTPFAWSPPPAGSEGAPPAGTPPTRSTGPVFQRPGSPGEDVPDAGTEVAAALGISGDESAAAASEAPPAEVDAAGDTTPLASPTPDDFAELRAAAAAAAAGSPVAPGERTTSSEAAPTTPSGDAAPLAAVPTAPPEDVPPWSRALDDPPGAAEPAAAALEDPGVLPPTAVADAWTTQPGAAAAPYAPRGFLRPREHMHAFGDRMAAGVLVSLAAASMIGGGIFALAQSGSDVGPTLRALICGLAAAVLLAGAVVLRLVRGTEDLRGALAVTGIAFAAACVVFAYNPTDPTDHDNLVKFALATGVVTILSWFAAVVVPSAVAGMLGVVALATGVGLGVWLLRDDHQPIQVLVAAMGVGLAVALVLPRLKVLRPHHTGLGWALGGAALVIAVPTAGLMATNGGFALAAGATASAALLVLAQQFRNLPAAIGAFVGLGYLELTLVVRRSGIDSTQTTTQLIVFVAIGAALSLLVAAAVMVQARRPRAPASTRRRWPLPVTIAELLLVAALALAVASLVIDTPSSQFTPNLLQPSTTATHTAPALQL
jgi:hypothetical protein